MSEQQEAKTTTVTTELLEESSVLDVILKHMRAPDEEQKQRNRDLIADFVREVMQGQLKLDKNLEVSINARIAQIDRLVSAQLNEIMHHKEFQKLEGSWRGLRHLVFESETSTMLKIKVLNVTKKELLRDLEKASEFDQSVLFKKVHDDGFGVFGGEPFGTLIGDYEFGYGSQDVAMLGKLAEVAAAAHAPFISAASSEMFGWESFTTLNEVRDLAKIFDQVEYIKWRSFRDSEDSRYVGLTLPHTLMREPYGENTIPTETFKFTEDVDGTNHDKYLWGNAAYSFGTRLTEAFALHNWCVAIRGVENGGLVSGLPVHTFKTDDGDTVLKCPTEVVIPDRRENEFSNLGFMPLTHCTNTDYAAFFGAQSCNKAGKYDTDAANNNARLSTQLQYMFAVSRFAHYLKAIMRDKIGAFMSRTDCERFLNRWIRNYVVEDDTAAPVVKAKHPLRDARVDVVEVPGKPGVYKAVAYLKPHYQLDEITVSLRLVAELPKPRPAG